MHRCCILQSAFCIFSSLLLTFLFLTFSSISVISILLQYLFDNQTVKIGMDVEKKVKNKEAKLSSPSRKSAVIRLYIN